MLVDGSETDDSNGAEVGEIGGDTLGPRSLNAVLMSCTGSFSTLRIATT